MYKWKIKNAEIDQSKLVEEIYRSRGVSDYRKLFNLNELDFNDPYLLHDMEKSVDRIMNAIKNNEKILVYGDYDVDGITSTYIVYDTLRGLGADIYYDIPDRFVDGYGLSPQKAFDMINEDYKLVITVDNGIKSIKEAQILKENGVDLIITDHHEKEFELPDAFAIIHTDLSDYPFKPLAGVGVAFKLSQALIGEEALEYVDIAALGTIADMMPLVDENRAIVNVGLKKMSSSSNVGLRSLVSYLDITTPSVADIQYKIAPRINACGRMRSAKLAVNLLDSDNSTTAIKFISTIEETNNKRKKLTKQLYDESIKLLDNSKSSVIVHSPKMHEGVIGIVASRLANEFSKVSVVLKEDEFTYKGSVRSYNGVDVIFILQEIKDLLIRYGGHQNAAGLEFVKDNLEAFKEQFDDLVPNAVRDDIVVAEGCVNIATLSIHQIMELDKYDLKDSLFIFDNIKPLNRYLIKGEHTKLILSPEVEAIFFNNKTLYNKLNNNEKVALLGHMDVNYFRGRYKKQIIIEDYFIK